MKRCEIVAPGYRLARATLLAYQCALMSHSFFLCVDGG